MLFGKWNYNDNEICASDKVFDDHIAFRTTKSQVFLPHTAGRYQVKKFRKTQCPIVERLVAAMMYHGRNSGKKLKAILIVKQTFEIIHLMTGLNPLGVFITAIKNGGPREDSQKIGRGGNHIQFSGHPDFN